MFENKRKFALWLHPETLEQVDEVYQKDDCRSRSEFIEKAVRFYLGYLSAGNDSSLLPNAFLSNMKSIVAESDNRQSRLLFKLSVEMAMMMNLLASMQDVEPDAQGRVLLPANIRQKILHEERDMEITGANDHVRVAAVTASGDIWDQFRKELPELLEMIAGLEEQKE